MKEQFDFLEHHKKGLEHLGFWQEGYKASLLKSGERK